jgi:hypothetical protein
VIMGSFDPPIRNLDAFDVVGNRLDGGVDLVISCSGPPDESVGTLSLIEQKVNGYLVAIAHENFPRVYPAAQRGPARIFISCEHPVSSGARGMIATLKARAEQSGIELLLVKRRSASSLYAVKTVSFAIFLCIALSACDHYYGISRRSTPIAPVPPDVCVVEAVTSVDGISHVETQLDSGGELLTSHGFKPVSVHRFFYKYEGLNGNLYLSVYNGVAELHQSYGSLNRMPPLENIRKIYPVFLAIEAALQSHCDMDNLRAKIRDFCSGVSCDGA